MTTSESVEQLQNRSQKQADRSRFEEQIDRKTAFALEKFKKVTRFYALFHILFCVGLILEILLFLAFFPFFSHSSVLAFSLAVIFLTGFSYFVLLFYFQAKKPEQLLEIQRNYVEEYKKDASSQFGKSEYHLSLAHSCRRFVGMLDQQEANYYPFFQRFITLSQLLKKFSIWCHWKDVHKMKEILLFYAIHEHIQLIKAEPTDLHAHAALADTYCALSKLYLNPLKISSQEPPIWVSPAYDSEEMQSNFKTAAERAVEEFKILDHYAPNDQWVHSQLAAVYHDLELPEEEIAEYEKMLKLSSQDRNIMLRLGILYFQQGYNAKGLKIYDQLKKMKDKKADELIAFYDAYITPEFSIESLSN